MIAPNCQCSTPETASVLGVEVAVIDPVQTLDWIRNAIECSATHVVNPLPAHPIVLAHREPLFKEILNSASLNVPDGMGVVLGCRVLGFESARKRVYGPDLMRSVLDSPKLQSIRHALLGGTPETLVRLLHVLATTYPDAQIVDFHAPPFRADISLVDVQDDLRRIAGSNPDIIWVGIGTPKQQIWAHYARRFDPAKVIVTVGAAFDFISGVKPQAPAWIRNRGFEWLYRLASEPRRLFRRAILDNAYFTYQLALQVLDSDRQRASN